MSPLQCVETAESFGTHGVRLRGMVHVPLTAADPSLGVVLCPPFGEERKSAARVMARAARAFCSQGIHVLRFDFRGTGESEGDFAQVRLQHWLEDINDARQHLAIHTGLSRTGLLGIRFGATLAALAASDSEPLPFLGMWSPVWEGKDCLGDVIRRLAATHLLMDGGGASAIHPRVSEMGTDLGGILLKPSLRKELEACDLRQLATPITQCAFAVRCTGAGDLEQDAAICRVLTVPGGARRVAHVSSRPFWVTASRFDPSAMVDCTLGFLREAGVLSPASGQDVSQ